MYLVVVNLLYKVVNMNLGGFCFLYKLYLVAVEMLYKVVQTYLGAFEMIYKVYSSKLYKL